MEHDGLILVFIDENFEKVASGTRSYVEIHVWPDIWHNPDWVQNCVHRVCFSAVFQRACQHPHTDKLA